MVTSIPVFSRGDIITTPPRSLCPSLISQAKSLLDELERLDVSFANDLSRLRQTYDTKKANLQAELRRLLDSQGAAAVA